MNIKRATLKLLYAAIGAVMRQDRRLAYRLPLYFPTYRAFFGELFNQLLRIAGSSRSFALQGIIIEPTNNCNLKCGHCATQRIEEKKGLLDYDFYTKILDDNPQVTCVILSRNGEPFLHPRIFDMIGYAIKRGVYVSLYTNGTLLSGESADRLLDIGLNEINFSLEGVGEDYEKNRHVPYGAFRDRLAYLISKRDSRKSGLKIGLNVALIDARGGRNVEMIRKEWGDKVDHIDVEPLMGKSEGAGRLASCRTLWRNAVVRWDGVVLPCCVDMESTLVMGDLKNQSLKEIFNGRKAMALRTSHLRKKFPTVCGHCGPLAG